MHRNQTALNLLTCYNFVLIFFSSIINECFAFSCLKKKKILPFQITSLFLLSPHQPLLQTPPYFIFTSLVIVYFVINFSSTQLYSQDLSSDEVNKHQIPFFNNKKKSYKMNAAVFAGAGERTACH